MKLMRQVKKKVTGEEEGKPTAEAGADDNAEGKASPNKRSSVVSGASKKGSSSATMGSHKFKDGENPFENIPTFRETQPSDHMYLFRRKLMACSKVYDFVTESDLKEKEAKRQTLLEMVQHVNDTRNCFNEGLMQDIVIMTSNNIFRSLPARRKWITPIYDPEEEEPALEVAWPHLQIVYELFLRFVVCNDVDAKVAKRYIDGNFILKMMELFDTEDARERDYLKTILHRAYGKFMPLRTFVRRAIQNVFFVATYETYRHNGIGELLEILGSIINGFALPLKEEHRDFLFQGLIPLHKVKHLASFHQQLSYCMTQYAEKDPRLAISIVESLLQFWPCASTSKQLLFLNELEEILEVTNEKEFLMFKEALFKQIAKCVGHSHFQVAERALFLWNNEIILKLLTTHKQTLYPIIIGSLYENSRHHWNQAVHTLTFNVLKMLMETDAQLFEECSKQSTAEKEKTARIHGERDEVWKLLEQKYEQFVEQGKDAPPNNAPKTFLKQNRLSSNQKKSTIIR